jgi:glucose uptake protein
MILPQTYLAALLVTILSMLCWGSWANTFKASKWRFELYYFDFAIGMLAFGLIIAFTAGSMGFDGFTFMDDMMHAGKRQWFYGFIGGVVFNLANMLLMAAISVSGMGVAFPVSIGLAIIIGMVSAFATKSIGGNPAMIFGGCGLILAAMIVCATAYGAISDVRHEEEARAGRAKSTKRPVPWKGIVIALVSGVLMGIFAPLLQMAQQGDVGLGPYSIAALFSIGVFFSTFVFNLFFMNIPVQGDPVDFMDYFKGRPISHIMGLFGGGLWILGGVAAFVASAPESTHLDRGVGGILNLCWPLIAAVWGIFVWKEFRGGDAKVKALLGLMFLLFVLGVGLVSMAPVTAPRAA